MNRFRDELAVIPRALWVVAIAVYTLLVWLILNYVAHEMPPVVRYTFAPGLPFIFCTFLLLTGYVYGDAKRRGMRAVMWTLLAFLIPNAIGFVLYFIMREPLITQCAVCNRTLKGQFAFCPYCGASKSPACPQCRRPVETQWPHCPHCGASLAAKDREIVR